MKTCPRVFLLFLLIIQCFALLDQNQTIRAEPAGFKDENKIVFQWAFCSLRETDTGTQLKIITRDTALKSGAQIKFFVQMESPGFLYLIYTSSRGEMRVLFPDRFRQPDSIKTLSAKHYIPQGNQWFELDEHGGQEKFYLLVSARRLFELEALINRYESADKAKRFGLSEKITLEIRNLRKRHLKFKTYAEKPVTVAGKLRGTGKNQILHARDIADYAVEISTTAFFSRTYTIDHQQE
jgi:hypothetical protein